ncbi:MAG TPA: hypothetical protein VGT61_07655 [Thermomicrobiales bacterium]|jgi:hypothetical protein|nr:hypothetical protein [Thermomicrobiales bacterium]
MTERPNQNPSSHDRSFRRDPSREQHTRDLDQAARTNPTGPEPYDPTFDEQLAPEMEGFPQATHVDSSTPASDDKALQNRLNQFTNDELSSLSVLERDTPLQQGSVYLDLNDLQRGPFKAIGGDTAGHTNRYIAKSETDYEMWNRLVGQDETTQVHTP